jgi:hypothetical protein
MLRVWGKGQCIGQRVLVGRPEGNRPRGIRNVGGVNNIKITYYHIPTNALIISFII